MAFADLTEEDLASYAEGRCNLADLAARAGISVQAVSQALKRRARRAAESAGAPLNSSRAPEARPLSAPALVSHPADLDKLREELRVVAGNAAISLLHNIAAIARGESSPLGASALKATTAALDGCLNALQRLEILDLGEANGIIDLCVRTMTPEEEAEARRLAEQGDQEFDLGTDDAADATNGIRPEAIDLPADLAERLTAYGNAHGAVALRKLAVAIGAPAGRSVESLAQSIINQVAASREALDAVEATIGLEEKRK